VRRVRLHESDRLRRADAAGGILGRLDGGAILVTFALALTASQVAILAHASAADTIGRWLALAGALLAVALVASLVARARHIASGHVLAEQLDRRVETMHDLKWELSDREARYRDLIDAQDDVILRRDAAGALTFANRAFYRVFGLAPDAVLGRPFRPEVVDAASRLAPLSTDDPLGRRQATELVRTAAGPRWIAWDERVVASSEPAGGLEVQCIGRDVTESRMQAKALAEARDQAEAASRAKSRFLAAMSHEIRTPMNGIIGMASLMAGSSLDAEQRTYLDGIDRSARNLVALIDEILDFSKIEAGKMVLAAEPFSLAASVGAAVALLEPQAAAKGLALDWSMAPSLPDEVVGDEMRLRQILLNLISNAIKFTDTGRIELHVGFGCEHAREQARGLVPGRLALRIDVRDSGIGLSAADMATLFDEFEQSDAAIRRRSGGTGLGLAISRRIARAMGGDIAIESQLGAGSTFTVRLQLGLPAAAADPAERLPAPAAVDGGAWTGVRVLLAEDSDINALLARRMIELAGCEVVLARNGREAVERVRDGLAQPADAGSSLAFDLILMDILMPDLDGVEATAAILALYAESRPGHRLPPIIALTANAFSEDRARYMAAGMADHLAKPFDKPALDALLRRWLSPVAPNGRATAPAV